MDRQNPGFVSATEKPPGRAATSDTRSVFISDVHLGTRGAQTERLLDFLQRIEPENLYLVGDILDFWKGRSGWFWPRINNQLVQTVVELAASGTRVVFIPGNHDEVLRDYVGSEFNGVAIERDAVHETAAGERYLVMHGDEVDAVVRHNKWVAYLGGEAYNGLLVVNRWFNYVRRRLGFQYWSLSAFLKHKVKNAANYIASFEQAVAWEAKERGTDGVICGHIHKAQITPLQGITYANCGDWVESCTALVERPDGRLEIVDWSQPEADVVPIDRHQQDHKCA
ncbi:UDP-2,3-diacylglucosamine diphosphatase [Thiohalorhabdus sp.]|uniref:UDP-2,3-diacylglucosamine diphosphatase n=1 Tax=Thiohalorhabdus sp. TaxID=3094134 RepID=UPI002FC346D9